MHTYSNTVIEKYAAPAPRYTSYPTAPHFHEGVDEKTVKTWMKSIPEHEGISVYIHIPFCDRLCWFCGCHTKHTLRYGPIRTYMQSIYREIEIAAKAIGRRQPIAKLHLGGGSPSLLKQSELVELKAVLTRAFQFSDDTEISLEFDPTDLTLEAIDNFAAFGVTRASLGVQDFNSRVQTAINRPQSFEQTSFVVEVLRDCGVTSLNIDALYGLPYQTEETLSDTLEKVADLDPDRIALFGYAHVPWVKPHQRLIPDTSLPAPIDRFWQARNAETILAGFNYRAIGIDHFAKPDDSLFIDYQKNNVRRNFQGYTNDNCKALIGFGTSAISEFPQGYAQNVKENRSYARSIEAGNLPVQRGITRSVEDTATIAAIDELMCYFRLTTSRLKDEFGGHSDEIISRAQLVAKLDQQGFFNKTADGFEITDKGRPFARTIVTNFDKYLDRGPARHSLAV